MIISKAAGGIKVLNFFKSHIKKHKSGINYGFFKGSAGTSWQ
jgi:hypothetical protein